MMPLGVFTVITSSTDCPIHARNRRGNDIGSFQYRIRFTNNLISDFRFVFDINQRDSSTKNYFAMEWNVCNINDSASCNCPSIILILASRIPQL